jgi:hypothetical protein
MSMPGGAGPIVYRAEAHCSAVKPAVFVRPISLHASPTTWGPLPEIFPTRCAHLAVNLFPAAFGVALRRLSLPRHFVPSRQNSEGVERRDHGEQQQYALLAGAEPPHRTIDVRVTATTRSCHRSKETEARAAHGFGLEEQIDVIVEATTAAIPDAKHGDALTGSSRPLCTLPKRAGDISRAPLLLLRRRPAHGDCRRTPVLGRLGLHRHRERRRADPERGAPPVRLLELTSQVQRVSLRVQSI